MTTELETNAHVSVPSPMSAMQDIPLGQIHESKTNPRRHFDQAKLAELADNIPQARRAAARPCSPFGER